MTAPRKPVACRDCCEKEARLCTDCSAARYAQKSDLQPLWALVERFERDASEADARASGFAAKNKYIDSDLWNEHASTKRKDASELRATLEAMQ